MIDPIVKALAEDRRDQQIGQRALAAVMGTQQSAISEAERGVTEPRLSTLRRWAEALGFDVVLVKREG